MRCRGRPPTRGHSRPAPPPPHGWLHLEDARDGRGRRRQDRGAGRRNPGPGADCADEGEAGSEPGRVVREVAGAGGGDVFLDDGRGPRATRVHRRGAATPRRRGGVAARPSWNRAGSLKGERGMGEAEDGFWSALYWRLLLPRGPTDYQQERRTSPTSTSVTGHSALGSSRLDCDSVLVLGEAPLARRGRTRPDPVFPYTFLSRAHWHHQPLE